MANNGGWIQLGLGIIPKKLGILGTKDKKQRAMEENPGLKLHLSGRTWTPYSGWQCINKATQEKIRQEVVSSSF